MVEWILWSPLSLVLWGVGITLLFIAGIQYLRKGRNRGDSNEKSMMFGWASYILGFAIMFIGVVLYDVLAAGTFKNWAFYLAPPYYYSDWPRLILIFANIAYMVGYVFFFYTFEKIIKRTRYIMTGIAFGRIIIFIVFRVILIEILNINLYPIMQYLDSLIQYIAQISLLIILYYVTKWARDEFKAISSLLFCGWYLLWSLYDVRFSIFGNLGFLFLKPILLILSSLIFIAPMLINPKFLKSSSKYWKIVGISLICFMCFKTFFLIAIGYWSNVLSRYFTLFGSSINFALMTYLFVINCRSKIPQELLKPKRDSFLRNLALWKILGLLVILYCIGTYFLLIYLGFTYNPIIFYINLSYIIAIKLTPIFLIIRSIKAENGLTSEGLIKRERVGFLDAIARPQKLTEEEVSISIERKICLVCKGEVSRNIYICPECKTFYCIKCSDALLNMENACWVCNTPFNEFKPSKPFEISETEAIIEGKDKNI